MAKILGISKDNIPVYQHETASHSHRPDLDAEVISKLEIKDRGFIRETIDMGKIIGVDHLVEIDYGDVTVHLRRGNRSGESKFVLTKEAQPTSFVTIIICQDRDPGETQGKYCLVTLFEGKPGEREPFDANIQNNPEALKASQEFWANHALVPTEEERKEIFQNKYSFISSVESFAWGEPYKTFKLFDNEDDLYRFAIEQNEEDQEAEVIIHWALLDRNQQRIKIDKEKWDTLYQEYNKE